MRIGIIGAGMTGLTAAYHLSNAGHEVVIYEHAPFAGGHASTFSIQGNLLERGYHHLFTSDTDIQSLVSELGIPDVLEWLPSSVGIYADGAIYDLNSPIDLLKLSPLKMINRFRLGVVLKYLQLQTNWMKYDHITATSWLRSKLGKQAYEMLWEPLLLGKFGPELYDKVPMAWIWGKLNTRVKSRKSGTAGELLGYPKGSFETILSKILERLAEQHVQINLGTPVNNITEENGRITLNLNTGGEVFDKVLSTVSNDVLLALTPQLQEFPSYKDKLSKVSYLSAVVEILVLSKPISSVYWLNIADSQFPFLGIIEHTNLLSPNEYNGKHIAYITNYVSTDHPIFNMRESQLLETYLPFVKRINPVFDSSWIEESFHFKISKAQPVMDVNYSQSIPSHTSPISNLFVANTSQIYPEDRGTNYSVRMGKTVAQQILVS
tara:strand:+ start:6242 stop:7546 length:1305 start_codon:yes stop_codon:yes gene_type:complete